MDLTEQQKRLIFHMKRHNMSIDEMTAVLLHLETELKRSNMINYLLHNVPATPKEVVDKAIEIGRTF